MTETLLDAVLAPGGIRVTMQPIFEIGSDRQRVVAVEALSRGPKGTNLEAANILFEYVRRKKEETVVDRACVMAGLMAARSLPSSIRIDLNVHASTLGRDAEFVDFLCDAAEACGIEPSRLVVEIVEHSPYWDGPAFFRTLADLRLAGISIALDDVGLGYSNYKMMIDSKPDYLKVDRYLVAGCHNDPYRQIVLDSIHQLARRLGATVVAEGVETAAEMNALLAIGIHYVQGYLLSPNRTESDLLTSGVLTPKVHSWRPAPPQAQVG